MSGFKAKMHQIRFPLGLSPRPRWGERTAFPRSLAVLNGPTSKAREGKGRGGERGREENVKESEGETRWTEGFGPPKNFGVALPMLHDMAIGQLKTSRVGLRDGMVTTGCALIGIIGYLASTSMLETIVNSLPAVPQSSLKARYQVVLSW